MVETDGRARSRSPYVTVTFSSAEFRPGSITIVWPNPGASQVQVSMSQPQNVRTASSANRPQAGNATTQSPESQGNATTQTPHAAGAPRPRPTQSPHATTQSPHSAGGHRVIEVQDSVRESVPPGGHGVIEVQDSVQESVPPGEAGPDNPTMIQVSEESMPRQMSHEDVVNSLLYGEHEASLSPDGEELSQDHAGASTVAYRPAGL